ncbi:hypothetical protein [Lentzea tibetensis]|uniref:hypothetical protein n=1 Tax=Lentzea tibetensis TaxID=2591470 RepID=UPI0016471686|nr:hypothetical protein [Lentzea tibetensis]
MKWPGAAGNSRKGVAETLTTVMPAMLSSSRGKPADKAIRRALQGWAFNLNRRDKVEQPDEIKAALKWLADNTKSASTLADADVARAAMSRLAVKLDGEPAAPATVKRKRSVWFNAMEYAVERRSRSSGACTTQPCGPARR